MALMPRLQAKWLEILKRQFNRFLKWFENYESYDIPLTIKMSSGE